MSENMVDYTGGAILSRPLHDMFTAIPPRYDLTNHILTWGLDKRWRREAGRECLASQPSKVLDLCCGTGDLAVNLGRLAPPSVEVTGLDYSQPMLDIAAKKAAPLARKPSFILGYADALPFPDGYFDCVGISFALRNLTYKNPLARRHIAEVFRVLAPGGKFVVIETSQPRAKLIKKLFHLYLRWWVLKIGSLVSGNQGAYRYLAESAARFYTPEELKQLLGTAGFTHVSFRPLLFGTIGIHVAIK